MENISNLCATSGVCISVWKHRFRVSAAIGPAMQHDIAEDLNAERYACENLSSCTYGMFLGGLEGFSVWSV
jgi:hypothetical protein